MLLVGIITVASTVLTPIRARAGSVISRIRAGCRGVFTASLVSLGADPCSFLLSASFFVSFVDGVVRQVEVLLPVSPLKVRRHRVLQVCVVVLRQVMYTVVTYIQFHRSRIETLDIRLDAIALFVGHFGLFVTGYMVDSERPT